MFSGDAVAGAALPLFLHPWDNSTVKGIVTFLSTAATGAALSAGLLYLCREWITTRLKNSIEHEYDIKLESFRADLLRSSNLQIETHKATLQVENAGTTERLKAELQGALSERQVRFNRLHEKVAEAVAEIYSRLSGLTIAAERYTSVFESPSMGTRKERREDFAASLKDFEEHFRKHKLYLTKSLAAKVKDFVEMLNGMAIDFMVGVEQRRDERVLDRDTWMKVNTKMRIEAKPLYEGLEHEFRGLLGVPNDPAPEAPAASKVEPPIPGAGRR